MVFFNIFLKIDIFLKIEIWVTIVKSNKVWDLWVTASLKMGVLTTLHICNF